MNGLVKEIQQWISPNRSKVYIISSSTHSGFNAAQGKLFCMQISRADVADLIYFMAIARHRSFSRAAIELGVDTNQAKRPLLMTLQLYQLMLLLVSQMLGVT